MAECEYKELCKANGLSSHCYEKDHLICNIKHGIKLGINSPQAQEKWREKEIEHETRNLVALIHRDGGHYVIEYGMMKALKDAQSIILKERQRNLILAHHFIINERSE